MIEVKKHGILLNPTELKFEDQGVANPACIEADSKIHMFYRAINNDNFSSLGYCELKAPTKVGKRDDKPILIPQEKYESKGMEDPRIAVIDGTYLLTYTAYDGTNALGALATSKDLKTFDKKGIITSQMTYKEFESCIKHCEGVNEKYLRFMKLFSRHGGIDRPHNHLIWDKDVAFFPKKINGKFAFLHRIYPDIQIAFFNELKDLNYRYWMNYLHNIEKSIVLKSKMPFEASYIGGGCPPIETSEGWLIIYHGVEDSPEGYIYHACAALVDLNEPTKEIGRLRYPLFSPELDWEIKGVVNNVVFPTATVLKGDNLFIYYGAADKYIGVASVSLGELIQEIKNSK
jgi:predicted GH43/DUF377 family glycosyl hydrolase